MSPVVETKVNEIDGTVEIYVDGVFVDTYVIGQVDSTAVTEVIGEEFFDSEPATIIDNEIDIV